LFNIGQLIILLVAKEELANSIVSAYGKVMRLPLANNQIYADEVSKYFVKD